MKEGKVKKERCRRETTNKKGREQGTTTTGCDTEPKKITKERSPPLGLQ